MTYTPFPVWPSPPSGGGGAVQRKASGLLPQGVGATVDFRLFPDGEIASPSFTNGDGPYDGIITLTSSSVFGDQQVATIEDGIFRLQPAGTQEAGLFAAGPYVGGFPTALSFPDDVPVEIGVLHVGFLDADDPTDLWDFINEQPVYSVTNTTMATGGGDGYTIQAETSGDADGNVTTVLALYRRVGFALGSPLDTYQMNRPIGMHDGESSPDRYYLAIIPEGATTRLIGMLNGRVVCEWVDSDPFPVSTFQVITHTHNNRFQNPAPVGKWRPGSMATWSRRAVRDSAFT
jgi:hypothetical protein